MPKSIQRDRTELQGVGGWLRFFVIVRMFVTPVASVAVLALGWLAAPSMAEAYGPPILLSLAVHTAVGLVLALTSVGVGVGLKRIRPGAVRAAKRWLLAAFLWSCASPLVAALAGLPSEEVLLGILKRTAPNAIGFSLWFSYFNVSKRVKATYPDGSEVGGSAGASSRIGIMGVAGMPLVAAASVAAIGLAAIAGLYSGWREQRLENELLRGTREELARTFEGLAEERENALRGGHETLVRIEELRAQLAMELDRNRALTSELATEERRSLETAVLLEEQRKRAEALTPKVEDLVERMESQVVEATRAREAAAHAVRDRDEARTRLKVAEARVAELERELETTELSSASLREEIDDLSTRLRVLAEAAGVDPEAVVETPSIDGTVLRVDDRFSPAIVALNRGSADGVRKGMTFNIFSGTQFKGLVRVVGVQEDICSAQVVNAVEGVEMKAGDSAATIL